MVSKAALRTSNTKTGVFRCVSNYLSIIYNFNQGCIRAVFVRSMTGSNHR